MVEESATPPVMVVMSDPLSPDTPPEPGVPGGVAGGRKGRDQMK